MLRTTEWLAVTVTAPQVSLSVKWGAEHTQGEATRPGGEATATVPSLGSLTMNSVPHLGDSTEHHPRKQSQHCPLRLSRSRVHPRYAGHPDHALLDYLGEAAQQPRSDSWKTGALDRL